MGTGDEVLEIALPTAVIIRLEDHGLAAGHAEPFCEMNRAHGQYKPGAEPDQALGYAPHGEGKGKAPDQSRLQGRDGDDVVLLIAGGVFPFNNRPDQLRVWGLVVGHLLSFFRQKNAIGAKGRQSPKHAGQNQA